MYGIRFINADATTLAGAPTTIALDYAILAGAIAEVVAGLLAVIRGLAYPGYVTMIFGIWLLGFALLLIFGTANKAFTPDAIAWYLWVLIPPVAIMAVPAIVHRHIPFIIAFAAILALQALAGLGNHDVYHAITTATKTKSAPDLSTAVTLFKASAWFAFIGAIAIWWVFARAVYEATGVFRGSSS
jgi:hypothetical protein